MRKVAACCLELLQVTFCLFFCLMMAVLYCRWVILRVPCVPPHYHFALCLPLLVNSKALSAVKISMSAKTSSGPEVFAGAWRKLLWPFSLVADEETKQIYPRLHISLGEQTHHNALTPLWGCLKPDYNENINDHSNIWINSVAKGWVFSLESK